MPIETTQGSTAGDDYITRAAKKADTDSSSNDVDTSSLQSENDALKKRISDKETEHGRQGTEIGQLRAKVAALESDEATRAAAIEKEKKKAAEPSIKDRLEKNPTYMAMDDEGKALLLDVAQAGHKDVTFDSGESVQKLQAQVDELTRSSLTKKYQGQADDAIKKYGKAFFEKHGTVVTEFMALSDDITVEEAVRAKFPAEAEAAIQAKADARDRANVNRRGGVQSGGGGNSTPARTKATHGSKRAAMEAAYQRNKDI